MKTTFALALVLALSLSACAKKDNANSQTQPPQQTGNAQTAQVATGGTLLDPSKPSTVALDGKPVTVAGVTFTAPAAWTSVPASGMRSANYLVAPVEGDKDSASLVVFYFGPQGGGGVEANIERWIGQMAMPDGSDPHAKARKLDFATTDTLKAHVVEVVGIFNAGSMGGAMGGASGPKEGYRMEGVVLECPGGNLFYKLTGPDKTVQSVIPGLQAMIMNAKKSQS